MLAAQLAALTLGFVLRKDGVPMFGGSALKNTPFWNIFHMHVGLGC
jgi:hypothetical protein